jgi:hypothetical protein
VDKSLIVVPWFRVAGYIKGTVEEVRSPSADSSINLPPTWLAAEEITRLSRELRYWTDLEDVANDDYGKDIAMQFTREVETALARWPIEDKPHAVRHVRCQECAGETIRYRPPQFDGDNVHIACTECRAEITEEKFTDLMTLLIEEGKKHIGGTRRLGAA